MQWTVIDPEWGSKATGRLEIIGLSPFGGIYLGMFVGLKKMYEIYDMGAGMEGNVERSSENVTEA